MNATQSVRKRPLKGPIFETIKAFLAPSHELLKGFLRKCTVLKVDLLKGHQIYCLQVCTFQAGNFSLWGSEEVNVGSSSDIVSSGSSAPAWLLPLFLTVVLLFFPLPDSTLVLRQSSKLQRTQLKARSNSLNMKSLFEEWQQNKYERGRPCEWGWLLSQVWACPVTWTRHIDLLCRLQQCWPALNPASLCSIDVSELEIITLSHWNFGRCNIQ